MRLASIMLGGGALALTATLIGTGSDSGPDDGTLVLDIIPGGNGGRFGVVVRQSRRGAGTLTSLYVAQGAAPEKGSHKPPDGRPVAAWRVGFPRLTWDGRRLGVIGSFEQVARQPGEACVASRPGTWDLCFDPDHVTYLPLPK